MGKKIADKLKSALGVAETFETNGETLKQICWDAVNVKCIAIEVKDGVLIRHYPPQLQAKDFENPNIKITPFK